MDAMDLLTQMTSWDFIWIWDFIWDFITTKVLWMLWIFFWFHYLWFHKNLVQLDLILYVMRLTWDCELILVIWISRWYWVNFEKWDDIWDEICMASLLDTTTKVLWMLSKLDLISYGMRMTWDFELILVSPHWSAMDAMNFFSHSINCDFIRVWLS